MDKQIVSFSDFSSFCSEDRAHFMLIYPDAMIGPDQLTLSAWRKLIKIMREGESNKPAVRTTISTAQNLINRLNANPQINSSKIARLEKIINYFYQ